MITLLFTTLLGIIIICENAEASSIFDGVDRVEIPLFHNRNATTEQQQIMLMQHKDENNDYLSPKNSGNSKLRGGNNKKNNEDDSEEITIQLSKEENDNDYSLRQHRDLFLGFSHHDKNYSKGFTYNGDAECKDGGGSDSGITLRNLNVKCSKSIDGICRSNDVVHVSGTFKTETGMIPSAVSVKVNACGFGGHICSPALYNEPNVDLCSLFNVRSSHDKNRNKKPTTPVCGDQASPSPDGEYTFDKKIRLANIDTIMKLIPEGLSTSFYVHLTNEKEEIDTTCHAQFSITAEEATKEDEQQQQHPHAATVENELIDTGEGKEEEDGS